MGDDAKSSAERLEALWQGSFGDSYTDRNAKAAEGRLPFWKKLLTDHPCDRVLEIGCNLGANLRWIAQVIPPRDVYGVDVNEKALATLRSDVPTINPVWARARELPFRDGFFDLVFTCGVLIHQPPDMLEGVMAEAVRCSRRYVLAMEYFAEKPTEVPYRDQKGALFKCDFGGLYQGQHPGLRLVHKDFLSKASGWDDLTVWLFEHSR